MSDRTSRLRRTLEGLVGIPATEGNHLEVLRNGCRIFPAMLDAIEQSERTIDLLTFVYWQGRVGEQFAEALAAKAREGVRVRVLLDAFGARSIRKDLVAIMEDGGCEVAWFRPFRRLRPGSANHRTHRKVLICDERVSFTGGVGIADEWDGDARDESEWRDTHVRLEGPATDGLRAAFVDNWVEATGTLFDRQVDAFPDQRQDGASVVQVVRGASVPGWSDIATVFDALICLAEERLRITTAYFVPDDHFLEVLQDTARRGVQVQLLLPGPHADKRVVQLVSEAAYEPLLDAGVEVWNFQPSMLHAKVLTVDGLVSVVGSANFNNRSRFLDEEVDLVVFDRQVTAVLDEHTDHDLLRSERIDPARWQERPVAQRSLEAAAAAGQEQM